MTRADFVNELSRRLNVQRRDMIEKDLILHQLLLDLSKNEFFAKNFIFKGGTCLIKCYFGYKRFSEDIDFTWKNQRAFQGASQNQIRRKLSETIDHTGKVFEEIAAKRALVFKCNKGDRTYVELGGSNRFCTFKLWYDSEILKRRSFVKVQINFVEELCFKIKRRRARSLLTTQDSQLKALFPEYQNYAQRIGMDVYDVREILSEKVRALLTRRGTKARDFVDVYLISKQYGLKPKDLTSCIVRKINFAIESYARFRSNLGSKKALLRSERIFDWNEERGLLLSNLDEADFSSFLKGFEAFLAEVVDTVLPPRARPRAPS